MRALDDRFPELDLFLHRVRRRLNLRFLGGEAGAAWLAALPAAVALGLVLPGISREILLLTVCGLGALGWVVVKARRRLSRSRAALWLDGAQGTQGLFQASADALDRPQPRPFDEAILTRANKTRVLLGIDRAVRYPWKRLGVRLLTALAATGLTWAVLSWVPPLGAPIQASVDVAARPQADPKTDQKLSLGKPESLTPRDTARRLFPNDPRLAALAEQALTSGDPQALDELLKATEDRSQALGQSPGTYQKRKLPGTGGQGVPGLGSDQGSGEEGTTQEGAEGPAAPDSSPNSPSAPGSGAPSPQKGGDQNRTQEPGAQGGGPLGGGTAPGSGHSGVPLGSRPWARPTDKNVVIPNKNQPGFFEYVMPGSGVKMPLAQALPHAQRTAEAALDRSAAPQEFTQTIADYFLSLSQEVKP